MPGGRSCPLYALAWAVRSTCGMQLSPIATRPSPLAGVSLWLTRLCCDSVIAFIVEAPPTSLFRRPCPAAAEGVNLVGRGLCVRREPRTGTGVEMDGLVAFPSDLRVGRDRVGIPIARRNARAPSRFVHDLGSGPVCPCWRGRFLVSTSRHTSPVYLRAECYARGRFLIFVVFAGYAEAFISGSSALISFVFVSVDLVASVQFLVCSS